VSCRGPRLLLIDNYDSFTWNLVHDFRELGARVDVRLNDEIDVAWAVERAFDAIVISPGPGRPEDAGVSLELVRTVAGRVPLLGVCLGHQAIAAAKGCRIVQAPTLMHGKTSRVFHDGDGLYRDLPSPFDAMRYHSLTVDPGSLVDEFEVTARTAEGVIMGIRHRQQALHGVQFHPESVLTPDGKPLLRNFLSLAAEWRRESTHAA